MRRDETWQGRWFGDRIARQGVCCLWAAAVGRKRSNRGECCDWPEGGSSTPNLGGAVGLPPPFCLVSLRRSNVFVNTQLPCSKK
jgi:hypothetical protein